MYFSLKSEVWIRNNEGDIFGRGFFNPYSQYRVRVIATVDLKSNQTDTFNLTLKELITKRISEGASPSSPTSFSLLFLVVLLFLLLSFFDHFFVITINIITIKIILIILLINTISFKLSLNSDLVHLAIALRNALQLPSKDTNVYRLVNGEGDRLGGLMVDVIGPVVVVQSSALWVEKQSSLILQVLHELLLVDSNENSNSSSGESQIGNELKTIIWRQSESRLKQDGFIIPKSTNSADINDGNTDSEELDEVEEEELDQVDSVEREGQEEEGRRDNVVVVENGLRFLCGPESDQKTGFYCDQRDNRLLVRSLSAGRSVLDAYCYSGELLLLSLLLLKQLF